MCGLFGVANSKKPVDVEAARQSLDVIAHRGPDGHGEWIYDGVFIGHRRLSILDLSDSGAQPMISEHCVVTVNGEIYNFQALKNELLNTCSFMGDSDSEVVLHGYRVWGLDALLQKMEGMYAIAIFDRRLNKLFLVRDRIGIKPIYYAIMTDGIVWSSELKPIVDYLSLDENDIQADSVLDFATYRYIPSPKTLYRNVYKLPAAHSISYDVSTHKLQKQKYWELSFQEDQAPFDEVLARTEFLLEQSIQEQLVSDVPLGSFLSGGIDSGLIMAMCQKMGRSLPTFSIGFDDQKFDETDRIKLTTNFLKIDNSLQKMGVVEASELFSNMHEWFTEPFADFSTLPTYLVCKFAREHVTVALSGDGADELFSGYPRYLLAEKMLGNAGQKITTNSVGWLKRALGWGFAGRLVRLLETKLFLSGWDWYCVSTGGMLPNESYGLARSLGVTDDYDRYWLYKDHWRPDIPHAKALRALELETSLPDALLTKVDRVSMRCSLEVRVPFLSTELVNYAFSLKDEVFTLNRTPKYLLRQLGMKYLPMEICTASKKGFGIPPSLRLSKDGSRCSVQYKTLVEQHSFEYLAKVIK